MSDLLHSSMKSDRSVISFSSSLSSVGISIVFSLMFSGGGAKDAIKMPSIEANIYMEPKNKTKQCGL